MKFIIEQNGSYAVVETIEYSGHTLSRLVETGLTLSKAERFLQEDAVPMNSCGAGQVAGIGIGPNGEPGVNRKRKLLRRIKKWLK